MRSLSLLAVAVAAAATFAAPASAAVECTPPVTVGSCYVHGENDAWTCGLGWVGVQYGLGTRVEVCLLEWQP
jgi:hypothetical protein